MCIIFKSNERPAAGWAGLIVLINPCESSAPVSPCWPVLPLLIPPLHPPPPPPHTQTPVASHALPHVSNHTNPHQPTPCVCVCAPHTPRYMPYPVFLHTLVCLHLHSLLCCVCNPSVDTHVPVCVPPPPTPRYMPTTSTLTVQSIWPSTYTSTGCQHRCTPSIWTGDSLCGCCWQRQAGP